MSLKIYERLSAISFSRPSGTDKEKEVAAFLEKEIRKIGFEPEVETFEYTRKVPKKATLTAIYENGEERSFSVTGVIDSSSTPEEGITAELYYLSSFDDVSLGRIKGKVVLIHDRLSPKTYRKLNLFLNGELDVVDFSYQRLSAIEGAGYTAQTYNNGRTAYLYYNLTNDYLGNKYIRQAISAAIDRDALVNGVLHVGSPADGFIPVGLAGDGSKSFREIVGPTLDYSYDVDNAKALLQKGIDELGLSDPKDITITILTTNTDEFIAVSGAIQQLLSENLGINVEVETSDSSAVRTRRNAFEYDLYLASWGADWDDATNFLGGYERDSSANPALFINEDFNKAYHDATYSTDLTERVKLLGEAEKVLLEEEAITPLYYTGQYYAVSNRVGGVLRRAVVPYLDLYYATVN